MWISNWAIKTYRRESYESSDIFKREAMGEDRAVASKVSPSAGTAVGVESEGAGGDFVDSANGSTLEGFAEGVSQSEHLLETPEEMGGRGSVAEDLEGVSRRVGGAGDSGVERVLPRCEFQSRQKRGSEVGLTKKGKGTKFMVLADGSGIPVGISLHTASAHEVTLAEATLKTVRVPRKGARRPCPKPHRLICDRAYDADGFRQSLRQQGIELIAPHKKNRKKPKTQDGRALRRYRRRWKIERSIAWLGNYRRLLIRWERSFVLYRAFFHIACALIACNHL